MPITEPPAQIRLHLIGSYRSAAVIYSFESLGRSSAIAFPPFAKVIDGAMGSSASAVRWQKDVFNTLRHLPADDA
jgi:hypothetical protein